MSYLGAHQGSFRRITRDEIDADRLVRTLDHHEHRVLASIVSGNSLRSIAAQFGVTEPQVEATRANILRKFGASTTADLIRIGIYAGIEVPA